jgi:putative ABC transport system ATP-binding protein
MTQRTIIASGLCKTYRTGPIETPVLQGIDLATVAGECVFLVGPSGSGKTTLLSILGCMLTPDRGNVTILGHDLLRLTDVERAVLRRDKIGFVFQRFQLIRGLNALQNVCVPLTLQGAVAKSARARARELLAAVGLVEKVDSQIHQLSTGQCQRVALARALAGNPELVLADEPTASLDAQNGQEVMRLLRRLTADEGKTAIVVTHDHRIFHFADRVFHLERGQIVRAPQPQLPLSLGAQGSMSTSAPSAPLEFLPDVVRQ